MQYMYPMYQQAKCQDVYTQHMANISDLVMTFTMWIVTLGMYNNIVVKDIQCYVQLGL